MDKEEEKLRKEWSEVLGNWAKKRRDEAKKDIGLQV